MHEGGSISPAIYGEMGLLHCFDNTLMYHYKIGKIYVQPFFKNLYCTKSNPQSRISNCSVGVKKKYLFVRQSC